MGTITGNGTGTITGRVWVRIGVGAGAGANLAGRHPRCHSKVCIYRRGPCRGRHGDTGRQCGGRHGDKDRQCGGGSEIKLQLEFGLNVLATRWLHTDVACNYGLRITPITERP